MFFQTGFKSERPARSWMQCRRTCRGWCGRRAGAGGDGGGWLLKGAERGRRSTVSSLKSNLHVIYSAEPRVLFPLWAVSGDFFSSIKLHYHLGSSHSTCGVGCGKPTMLFQAVQPAFTISHTHSVLQVCTEPKGCWRTSVTSCSLTTCCRTSHLTAACLLTETLWTRPAHVTTSHNQDIQTRVFMGQ